jgi:hypothetical protein
MRGQRLDNETATSAFKEQHSLRNCYLMIKEGGAKVKRNIQKKPNFRAFFECSVRFSL